MVLADWSDMSKEELFQKAEKLHSAEREREREREREGSATWAAWQMAPSSTHLRGSI